MLNSKVSVEYAVGRIHALENTCFLTQADFRKLDNSKNIDEFLQVLKSLNYGKLTKDSQNCDWMDLIYWEISYLKELIKEISPNPKLTDLLFIDADMHNLKLHLKSKYSGTTCSEDLFLPSSVFPIDLIKICVDSSDYSLLGKAFSEELLDIKGSTDFSLISSKVDKACFRYIFDELKKIPKTQDQKILTEYFRKKARYINTLAKLRMEHLSYSEEEIKKLTMDITSEEGSILDNGEKTLEKLEESLEGELLSFLEPYKYDILSIVPIIYFFQRKKCEILHLKKIAITK